VSTVNWAEVVSKLHRSGVSTAGLWNDISTLGPRLVSFTARQAEIAGELQGVTRKLGLSLGDRACLAVALDRRATALTADRAWAELDLDVVVTTIR